MRNSDKGLGVIITLWIFGILLNLAFWGVVVWAIIKLVSHFTGG